MKFTLSWLKEHLETNASLDEIAKTLTAIGLEVEQIIDPAAELAPFIVAEVLEAVQHPDANKLRVCKVNDGATIRQVVCGAPNARAGIKVALATEGVKIPESGIVLKKTTIRGVESNGMLCSAHELGLSEDSEGIIELPAFAQAGDSIVNALGLADPVIEIAITPNRADCLGVYGVARDLAAAGLGKLVVSKIGAVKNTNYQSPITIHLDTRACPLFIGCYLKGVKNSASPDWLQQRLKAIGLRPISALVDITNYITIAYGRPLHVFDAKKLRGNITVRSAEEGEKLQALNDKEYTLSSDMIAVCDDAGVIALGGIIGGTSTSCDDTTTEVFLEAALFDPMHIASTGRALGIESDARYRFERGVDPAFVNKGAEIAVAMIQELCGGEASEWVVAGKEPQWQRAIAFNPKKVETLGGMHLPQEQITNILTALGFAVNGGEVTPPSWRADVQGEADLVEDVLRIARYDAIEPADLPQHATLPLQPHNRQTTLIRKTLVTQGMVETYGWAFVSKAMAQLFDGKNEALALINPISPELAVMRPSLLPGLISAVARNSARGFADLALFEIGNCFEKETPEGQKRVVAGVRSAQTAPRNAFKTEREVDAFDAKGDMFAVLEAAGLSPARLAIDRNNVPSWYHPARAGRISLGGKITLGFFGELHPLTLAECQVENRVVAFEVFLDAISQPRAKGKARPPLQISNFQAVERDFAFIADERLPAGDIIKALETVDKQLVRSVNIFDVYAGKGVEPGKKSVAVAVTLQASDHTLAEQEIDATAQKILAAAAKLGLALRG